jgi:hypothetical protein
MFLNKGNLFLVLLKILIVYVCTASSSNICLSQSDLINNSWTFYGTWGYIGQLRFEANGTVTGIQNFNEKFWTFDGKNGNNFEWKPITNVQVPSKIQRFSW